jgi:hypothetical protein
MLLRRHSWHCLCVLVLGQWLVHVGPFCSSLRRTELRLVLSDQMSSKGVCQPTRIKKNPKVLPPLAPSLHVCARPLLCHCTARLLVERILSPLVSCFVSSNLLLALVHSFLRAQDVVIEFNMDDQFIV